MQRPVHAPRALVSAVALAASLVFGCGASVESPATDAAPGDATTSDAPAGCRLSDGSFCALGASCPSPDGCTTCSCQPDGQVLCTLRACATDAGPSVDVTPLPDTGARPDAGAPRDVGAPSDLGVVDAGVMDGGYGEAGVVEASVPGDANPATDAGTPSSDIGYSAVCNVSGGPTFPALGRTCAASTDCATFVHQTDCCGNSRAFGVSVLALGALQALEDTCRPLYPRCGCPSRAPVLDDGSSGSFGGPYPVDCVSGQCRTHGP